MKILKSHKTFAGHTQFYSHFSRETNSEMRFSLYLPEGKIKGCLIWLSGLTCTEENFIMKAGAQKYLAQNQLMVVVPDTSPRGLRLPDDFGPGAGFYVDATVSPYKDHFRMYSYVSDELYGIIQDGFDVEKFSIFGHSMGGHGALVLGLREPKKFKSISALAPVSNPMVSDLGIKAFTTFLGPDRGQWSAYDACELIKSKHKHPNKILVHQGTLDEFKETSMKIPHLERACKEMGQELEVKYAEGYDHSYYFVSTFIEEHILFHCNHL